MTEKKLREGFTTGACSAAAAKAAARILLSQELISEIETTLPNKRKVVFSLQRCELYDDYAVCSVIKDAGDDPDCTHGAELTAQVRFISEPGVVLKKGDGVAIVTKPGLGLELGGPSITATPRKNITEMVMQELASSGHAGAEVTISVPGGEEMAKKTLNERLGLIGGISILGTTGIVRPYSTAAYKARVIQAIAVARELGSDTVVLTTGGKSEKYAMDLLPDLAEVAFIQVGDFIGTGIKTAAKQELSHVIVVGMIGKLSKMADGVMMTHRGGSSVDTKSMANIARTVQIPEAVCAEIEKANTARHVLDICKESGNMKITDALCELVVANCRRHSGTDLPVTCYMVDFDGTLIGQFPQTRGEI